MAPLQKRAFYQLMVALAGALLLMTIMTFCGMSTAVLISAVLGVVVVYWLPRYLTRPRPNEPVIVDERDRVILSKVSTYQRIGVMLTVCVWVVIIILRTHTGTHGQITVSLASLVWLVNIVFIADATFSVVGTLIEYWRTK